MQKGFGYGSLGAGRYGMSGGMGSRPPRGSGVPSADIEFTTEGVFTFTPTQENCFIQCWGSGGAGSGSAKGGTGVGGGGGAYAEATVVLDTNIEYSVAIGATSAVVFYNDGINPAYTPVQAASGNLAGVGIGGQEADCIGDTIYEGGNGGARSPNGITQGGGGGSSAGPANNGVNGSDGADDGTGGQGAVAPTGGGNGGSAGGSVTGLSPGGGGAGAAPFSTIGAGGVGKVTITYV